MADSSLPNYSEAFEGDGKHMSRKCVWDVNPDYYFEANTQCEKYIQSVSLHCGRHDAVDLIKQDIKGKETLDVGCGPRALGSLSNLDLLLRGKYAEMNNFVYGSGEYLPYKTESFEAVTMFEVIEHVHNPTQTLSECYRVLKKDGVLHLTTPNLAHLSINLRYLMNHRVRIHTEHMHGWIWEMLVWLLHLCGFKDIEVYTWGFVDEMRREGKKVNLYRSYRLCNFLDRLGFKFPFLYLNIYCRCTKQ